MEIIRFARNNIYRIGTNSTACAVSVPVGDTEMLEYSKYEKCSDCFGSYHYDVNSNLV